MTAIGFTGTRNGMTPAQMHEFGLLLYEHQPTEFHHGDCIGADTQAADKVHSGMGTLCRIVCHPPEKEELRAFNPHADETRPAKSHFARNRDIVDASDVLVACPPYSDPITPQTRGGTAYTVGYARKQGKPVAIVAPDGAVTRERWNGL